MSGAKAGGACKAYLVKGRKKNLMIDTGLPTDAEARESGAGRDGRIYARKCPITERYVSCCRDRRVTSAGG